MELICPSCEARYQVPDGSISAKGRQVSCMNCGHSWHAYPPLQLGDGSGGGSQSAAQPRASDPSGITYNPPAGQPRPGEPRVQDDRGPEMGAENTLGADDDPLGEPAADPRRPQQMAEIRQMLAEVKSEERDEYTPPDESDRTVVMPAEGQRRISPAEAEAERARIRLEEEREAAMLEERARRAAEEAESDTDLRRRIESQKNKGKSERSDVKKLRRKHDRKVARKAHASKAGSGAFLTGFLLVVIIASTMAALYLLAPEIVARMPEAERPMAEYVATMDRLRVGAAESLQSLRDIVVEKLGDPEDS